MTLGDCGVCERPIRDPSTAVLMRDAVRDVGDGPGAVEYRHTTCDPADAFEPEPTTIDW